MGIKGLTSYMKRCGAYVVVDLVEEATKRHQNHLDSPLTIVVDGMSLCYNIKNKEINFNLACAYIQSSLHPFSFKTFATNARAFLQPFITQGIVLIVVFDGIFEPIKNSTRTHRRSERWDYIKETMRFLSTNAMPREPETSSTMIYRLLLIQILNEFNINHMTVQGEADQFIAKLCKTNGHYAVMANDSDYFIMGVDFIMLNTLSFQTDNAHGITCQLYTKEKVMQVLKVDENKVALFACLMDNDYVEEKHLTNFYGHLKILKKNSFDMIKKLSSYVQTRYSESELIKYLGKSPYENFLRAVAKFRLETEDNDKIDISLIDKCPKEIEQRFYNGEFMVALLGILFQKENWLSIVPMSKTDFDAWRIVLPLRRRVYGMLFGPDDVILERTTGHKPKKVSPDLSLAGLNGIAVHFSEYFTQNTSQQSKIEALVNIMTTNATDLLKLFQEIPPQLFLAAVCLRYVLEVQLHWTHMPHDGLKKSAENNFTVSNNTNNNDNNECDDSTDKNQHHTQNDHSDNRNQHNEQTDDYKGEKNNNNLNSSDSSSSVSGSRDDIKAHEYIRVLTEKEFDILLAHLIDLSTSVNHVTTDHVTTLPTARGLYIGSVFYLCFQQALLFNTLLNNPFAFDQIRLENIFEGNKFHRLIRNAKYSTEFSTDLNDEQKSLHNTLKTTILSNLNKNDVFKPEEGHPLLLTMPTKLVLIGPPSLVTDLMNTELKKLPGLSVVKYTARQVLMQTTNEGTAKRIVQYDGVVLNGLPLAVELQRKAPVVQ